MGDLLKAYLRDTIAENFIDLLRQIALNMEESGLSKLTPDDLRMIAQDIELKYLKTKEQD